MRTFNLKASPLEIRTDSTSRRVILVFITPEQDLRLFRMMDLGEAQAFHELLGQRLKAMEE